MGSIWNLYLDSKLFKSSSLVCHLNLKSFNWWVVVAHTSHLPQEGRGIRIRWISEFKASLVYSWSSRTAKAIWRNPVSKTKKKHPNRDWPFYLLLHLIVNWQTLLALPTLSFLWILSINTWLPSWSLLPNPSSCFVFCILLLASCPIIRLDIYCAINSKHLHVALDTLHLIESTPGLVNTLSPLT